MSPTASCDMSIWSCRARRGAAHPREGETAPVSCSPWDQGIWAAMVLLARGGKIALTPAAHSRFATDELPCQVRPNADGQAAAEAGPASPANLVRDVRPPSREVSGRVLARRSCRTSPESECHCGSVHGKSLQGAAAIRLYAKCPPKRPLHISVTITDKSRRSATAYASEPIRQNRGPAPPAPGSRRV